MSKDIHKWSDGRYTLMFDEHTFFVWDNEKDKRMTALQVTERLNEQQATIDQLNLAIDDLLSHTSCDEIKKENEQLRQVVEQYRKTNKHLSELCADASKNGYLPPLEGLR